MKEQKAGSRTGGREEMNLAEFPLVMLAEKSTGKAGTIKFSDSIDDEASGKRIKREWIVTSADAWGPLNWQDVDVLLALIVLTWRKTRFSERTVYFSLYELRQLLQWQDTGPYNTRLKTALKRVLGVTVACENSWRRKDKEGNYKWVSLDAFGLVDNVRLTNTAEQFDEGEKQHFKWNDVIVESMQAGHSKSFDWDFYISLKRPISKRLYRFLDKRFGLRSSWRFQVKEFCPNKLGMKPGAPVWRYRDNLKRGIGELVDRGFLVGLGDQSLFTKQGNVAYVNFRRRSQAARKEKEPERNPDDVELLLIAHDVEPGVSKPTSAGSLAQSYPEQKIRRCVAHYDKLNADGEKKTPGYLIDSIRSESERGFVPADFKTREEIEAARTAKLRKAAEERAKKDAEEKARKKKEKDDFAAFERARDLFPEDKQLQLEDDALSRETNDFLTRGMKRDRADGKVGMWHRMLWEKWILPEHEEEVHDEWEIPESDEEFDDGIMEVDGQ